MGRRSRRSASNVISAAILEVFIMGLFVIIAQPQLRDALMGILHVNDGATTATASTMPVPGRSPASTSTLTTSQSDAPTNKSILPQLSNNSGGSESTSALGTVSNLAGMAASALQGLANATAPAPAGSTMNHPNPTTDSRIVPPANAFSSNAPLEHYESFRVSVPGAQQAQFDYRQALPSTSNRNNTVYQEPSSPGPSSPGPPSLGMVPFGTPTGVAQNHFVSSPVYPMTSSAAIANYPTTSYPGNSTINNTNNNTFNNGIAPFASGPNVNRAPTQLVPGQWNIASANQSPQPAGGWNVVRTHETSYQEPYPPPYGTQSQWK